jgi:hypothetical protein
MSVHATGWSWKHSARDGFRGHWPSVAQATLISSSTPTNGHLLRFVDSSNSHSLTPSTHIIRIQAFKSTLPQNRCGNKCAQHPQLPPPASFEVFGASALCPTSVISTLRTLGALFLCLAACNSRVELTERFSCTNRPQITSSLHSSGFFSVHIHIFEDGVLVRENVGNVGTNFVVSCHQPWSWDWG